MGIVPDLINNNYLEYFKHNLNSYKAPLENYNMDQTIISGNKLPGQPYTQTIPLFNLKACNGFEGVVWGAVVVGKHYSPHGEAEYFVRHYSFLYLQHKMT